VTPSILQLYPVSYWDISITNSHSSQSKWQLRSVSDVLTK